ncbi:MAG: DUF3124 domain-containing protein [Bdellovibrionaceae bacterium]|nr:DUF3124 domain-containing protein [Pseudobdellovibrionaceae bacterium]NUM57372.1 DUF3124 domain-containing protein [Pseudobdellovibrionaceae bacterium]
MKILSIIILFQLVSLLSCTKSESQKDQAPVVNAYTKIDSLQVINNSKGQTVYIPIYSHIPVFNKEILSLRAILSVRNTSAKENLIIAKIDYYDTNGKLLKSYLDQPISLAKMATYEVEISSLDISGGTGANFIVKWDSMSEISSPIIESLMYGANGHHSYSFISRGQIVEKH